MRHKLDKKWTNYGKVLKVSIIIPIHNAENTLKRCVDSVLSQTFADFELILIDDGSNDASPSIIDEYATADSRIIAIHKPNGGVSSARNTGLDAAIGEYVAFVDSDDYVSPTYLEDTVKYDEDVIICGITNIRYQNGNDTESIENYVPTRYENILDFLREQRYMSYIRTPWAKIVKKEIIDTNKLRFDSLIKYGEDTIFNFEVFTKSKNIRIIAEPNYHYVVPPPPENIK